MRNIKFIAVAALVAGLGVISCSKEDAVSSEADDHKSTARVSENSAVGDPPPYFDLNIIGIPQDYPESSWPTIPNTIFVPLGGKPKIMMIRGEEYIIRFPSAIGGFGNV